MILRNSIDPIGSRQLITDLLRPRVLPDDRVRVWLTGVAIPCERCLALVGDADRADVAQIHVRHCLAHHLFGAKPDLARVMLDPAGLGENLLVFLLRDAYDAAAIKQDRPRARRPLVDGENVLQSVVSRVRVWSLPMTIPSLKSICHAVRYSAKHLARTSRQDPSRSTVQDDRRWVFCFLLTFLFLMPTKSQARDIDRAAFARAG